MSASTISSIRYVRFKKKNSSLIHTLNVRLVITILAHVDLYDLFFLLQAHVVGFVFHNEYTLSDMTINSEVSDR